MVNVEVESKEGYGQFNITCPKCGSGNVKVDKKGYAVEKGLCGICCCGWPGLLCGLHGSKQLEGFCFNCGNRFDLEPTLKKKWQEKE